MKKLDMVREKLKDSRSSEVIFISHCLLNINTRYLGGAFRRGGVEEIVSEAMQRGIGIVQMECPERLAWGGVLKKYMWLVFDSQRSLVFRFRRILLPIYICYTRLVYRSVAAAVVKQIRDYTAFGFTVKGIIGVDGSPTCGINTKLDMKRSFEFLASCSMQYLNRETFNEKLYETCAEAGSGMFIEQLKKLLHRKRLQVPVYAHSLFSEMRGEPGGIWR
jgi:predicted secreted protein